MKKMPRKIRLLVPPSDSKPAKYQQLLQCDADTKTRKGTKKGFLTGIMYLAPADESGVMNTCTSASPECKRLCLFGSGMARVFPSIKAARIAKTILLHEDRKHFLECLRYDIRSIVYTAEVYGLTPAIRINGTSDLAWLAMQMAAEFPDVQFYDYTKHAHAWTRVRPNYHLTFSHSGNNLSECFEALQHGVNVAVVFDTPSEIKGRRKAGKLPASWCGYQVIDGDKTDLRFLDASGVVVGIRVKDTAQDYVSKPTGSFFVSLGQLQAARA
jgi:hypothetical protein